MYSVDKAEGCEGTTFTGVYTGTEKKKKIEN